MAGQAPFLDRALQDHLQRRGFPPASPGTRRRPSRGPFPSAVSTLPKAVRTIVWGAVADLCNSSSSSFPVHFRHVEVGNDHVCLEGLQFGKSVRAVLRGDHFIAPPHDHASQGATLIDLVVNNQNFRQGSVIPNITL